MEESNWGGAYPSWIMEPQKRKVKQGKGKAIPLQAWRGPEGSRKLRIPDSKTVGT